MILFSTVLSMKDCFDKEDFMNLVIQWNQDFKESAYEGQRKNAIETMDWDGSFPARFGEANLWLSAEEYRDEEIVSVRYEKRAEDGAVWDTDYIMNFKSRKLAICLNRCYVEGAPVNAADFSTPYFIKNLIEAGYILDDGDLPVSQEPVYIGKENITIMAELIKGERSYAMPVIYVSMNEAGEYYLEEESIQKLARLTKGVAHVLVQRELYVTNVLRELCDGKNVYGGAIGIYYPGHTAPMRYMGNLYNEEYLRKKSIDSVINFMLKQEVPELLTHEGVELGILNARETAKNGELQKLQEDLEKAARDKNDYEEYAELQEKELEELHWKIRDLQRENQQMRERVQNSTQQILSMQAENKSLQYASRRQQGEPLLYMGAESDSYPGEIKDLVLTILSETLPSLTGRKRRHDVVQDIVAHNDFQKQTEKNRDELKNILESNKKPNETTFRKLKELGLEKGREKNHYEVLYGGDPRYHFTMGKTPGGGRGSKNLVSKIINDIY